MSEITCNQDLQLSLNPEYILDAQLSQNYQEGQQLPLLSHHDATQTTQGQMLASNWNNWPVNALETEERDKELEMELMDAAIRDENRTTQLSSAIKTSNIVNNQANSNTQEPVCETEYTIKHEYVPLKKPIAKTQFISKGKSRFRAFKKGQFDPTIYQKRTSPFGYPYMLCTCDEHF